MNKRIVVVALSLISSGSAFAARSECFRPYRVEISNKSGGLADVKRVKGLSGVSSTTEIPYQSSIIVMVKKRGAELKISAGPEDAKSTREIEFYSKEPNSYSANVILNQKGVATNGFSTKEMIYQIKVINESGGNVKITETCAVSGAGNTLGEGKSMTMSVKPDGYIVVQSGPEGKKVTYRITFADQTGDNPTLTFSKRSFMSSGIQQKNLDVQIKRVLGNRIFIPTGPHAKTQVKITGRLVHKKKSAGETKKKETKKKMKAQPPANLERLHVRQMDS